MPSVTGLLLAAGAGRRFGSPKALALLDGVRLVDRAVAVLTAGGCDDVLVVSGAVPLDVPGADVVHNEAWDTGMGSSLRAGLAAVTSRDADSRGRADVAGSGAGAVVVLLVDTPWVGPDAVRRLREAHARGAVVAQATYRGLPGQPVLLGRPVWPQVAVLAVGDQGARAFLRAHASLVTPVDCDGTGDPRDVDRPHDLRHPPPP